MKVHLLSGFLGSGKTTAIQQACNIFLKQGLRVGVITNDQGIKLVDGNFFKSLDIPNRQVVDGCFCCKYNDLNKSIESLIEERRPDIIFAESVGSCTDIVATVVKPLLLYRKENKVTVSTFADARLLYMLLQGKTPSFNDSVIYIYKKQLEEAGLIIVNKIDLMSTDDLKELTRLINEKYARKEIIFQNSLDVNNVALWIQALEASNLSGELSSLDIDYEIYGAGEAKLAWLDQELEIFNSYKSPYKDAVDLINLIYEKIVAFNYSIGHLKFLLNEEIKMSFTSSTSPKITPEPKGHSSSSATLLINARIETTPDIVYKIISEAIKEISIRSGCVMATKTISAFQPKFPRPTHRIVN